MTNTFSKIFHSLVLGLLLLAVAAVAVAQDEPSDCVVQGGLAWDDWTKEDAGGSGELPDGVVNKDYIRCKACHGWDHMATDGGYVRRSRRETRPNAGAGDGDSTSRNISLAARGDADVTADMIWHEGTGRTYAEGTGSWVALDDAHSAGNKAAHANGFTLGNQHPDYTQGGMTQEQADCLTEFLNFDGADPSAYFANIDPTQNPVLYTIVDTADAEAGKNFFEDNCEGCHDLTFTLDYLSSDGKFSELSHKARWGAPDTIMTRENMGNPTAQNIADMLLYLQEAGFTGFAINPGVSGAWWAGMERSGEGWFVDVADSNGNLAISAAFYTYDSMGNQVWLVATGQVECVAPEGCGTSPLSGWGNSAEVDVFVTQGRMWGDAYNPDDGSTDPWGTGVFQFSSCTSGFMSLSPNAEMQGMGFTDLEYDLQRDLVNPLIACPTPNG